MGNKEIFELQFDTRMEDERTGEIMVYSRISSYKWTKDAPDVTAVEFDAALKKLKDVTRLNLRINSPGGDVYEAMAMRAMLDGHSASEKHIYIEGMCASAATLLASIPGWTVHIAEGSMYMIHNPRTYEAGDENVFEKALNRLRQIGADVRAMYAKRCGKDEATIKQWMDATKWFPAAEAVAEGFADEITQGSQIAACAQMSGEDLRLMRELYERIPEAIAAHIGEAATISNAEGEATAPEATEYNEPKGEEKTDMDMTTLTLDQLKEARADLMEEIAKLGAATERERMKEIDALTPPGYEQMAADAKESGESAMEYHKRIVKAQREKGAEFMETRKGETEMEKQITGGTSTDNDKNDTMDAEKLAKELAELAPEGREI